MNFEILLESIRYQLNMRYKLYGKIDMADVNAVINGLVASIKLKGVEDEE